MKRANLPVNKIAQITKVSPATVSRVLNHPELVNKETKNLIEKAIVDLGYNLEEVLQKQIDQNKRVIMAVLPSIDNPFYNNGMKGIKTSANSHDFDVVIYLGNINRNNLDHFLDVVKMSNSRGVVCLNRKMEKEVADTINSIVPLIQCCEYNKESTAEYVSINDYAAAKNATEYMLNLNYRKIALINGPLSFNYAEERLRGFEAAMEEKGITVPKNWKISLPEVSYSLGYSAASQLLGAKEKPDAIFCAADVFAISVIKAAKRYGLRVPEDVGVVGFDNVEMASITIPGITTVNQPAYQIGFTTGETIYEKISNPNSKPRSILLDTELIARDSIIPHNH